MTDYQRHYYSLEVRRMPQGGYVVQVSGRSGTMDEPLFACSDIDDALGFIKDKLEAAGCSPSFRGEKVTIAGMPPPLRGDRTFFEQNGHGDIVR